MKTFKKLDKEFPDMKPKVSKLKAVCVEHDDTVVNVTSWLNGEGVDIAYETKGDKGNLSVSNDVAEYVVRAFIKLKII